MKQQKIFVEYLDHMGDDLAVVNAARASFGKQKAEFTDADANLIKFLATGYRTKEWVAFLQQIRQLVIDDFQSGVIRDDILGGMLRTYKRKPQHWAPFAHPHVQIRVSMPLFLARQFVKHCVTGDTEITFVKRVKGASNGLRKTTIRQLYAMWTGVANKYQGGEKGKRNVRGGHVRVFDEQAKQFTTSHINDVIYQGVKPVYKVTTASGQSIRATGGHEVMTQRGWVRVDTLLSSDSMVTEVGSGEVLSPAAVRWNDWTDKQARRGVTKVRCASCGSTENLEADHIVPVRHGGGHDPENLQCLCAPCHAKKSNVERSRANIKNQYSPRFTRVVAIEPDGEEEVYDVSVDTTHNFMANGLVVHNCVGGTWSEESRRYISDEPGVWFPAEWHIRPEDIKQGSGGLVHDQVAAEAVAGAATQAALDDYARLLELGVAPEEARTILPLNMMTTVVWTGSLLFWSRVCNQRVDSHAQLAAQELGKLIAGIVEPLFPASWVELTK